MKKIVQVCLIVNIALSAESFEETRNRINSDFKATQIKIEKDFKIIQSRIDKDFGEALKHGWKNYRSTKVPSQYKRPKPIVIPAPMIVPNKQKDMTPKIIIPRIKPIIKPRPVVVPRPLNVPRQYKRVNFDFYGVNVKLLYNPKLHYHIPVVDKNSLSKYWNYASSHEVEILLKQLRSYKEQIRLNDWHLYLFVQELSKHIAQDRNNANLLTWFLMNKMDYDIQLGFNQTQVVLLPRILQQMFTAMRYMIGGYNYWNLLDNRSLAVYATPAHRAGGKGLNLAYNSVPNLPLNAKRKILSFNDNGQHYNISLTYNENIARLYDNYPTLEWKYLFKTPVSNEIKQSLYPQLLTIMKNKTELQAVNFLLHLTQLSFKYKTDHEQFGREKYFFFEESLYFPYNDCEDRSIFFGKLVKELLGLNVVALHYPNHLATAVEFTSNVKGDSVFYNGRKYVVADPTYFYEGQGRGANVGIKMPQFKGVKALNIIPVEIN